MDDYKPKYDDTKEMETIFDFHGAHIFRMNTSSTDLFLKVGKEFDAEVVRKLGETKNSRLIYIIDKVPPLSAILSFVEHSSKGSSAFDADWSVYAVVLPQDVTMANKFVDIVTYGLDLTKLKHKYAFKFFDYTNRNDLTHVFDWIKEHKNKPLN